MAKVKEEMCHRKPCTSSSRSLFIYGMNHAAIPYVVYGGHDVNFLYSHALCEFHVSDGCCAIIH